MTAVCINHCESRQPCLTLSLSLVTDYTTQVNHALVLLSRLIGMCPRRAAGWQTRRCSFVIKSCRWLADWLARAVRMNTPARVVMVILWLYCWLPREKAGGGHRTELSLLFLRHLLGDDDNGALRRPPLAPGGRRPGAPNAHMALLARAFMSPTPTRSSVWS